MTMPVLLNDVEHFRKVAADGSFSGQAVPETDVEEHLTRVFTNYVISEVYTSQGIVITHALNTNIRALQTNATRLVKDTHCLENYNNWGMCDSYFYGRYSNRKDKEERQFHNFSQELAYWFDEGYTTLQLLFSYAHSCAKAGGTEKLTDKCESNMEVCTWNMTPSTNRNENEHLGWEIVRSQAYSEWNGKWCKGPDRCGDDYL